MGSSVKLTLWVIMLQRISIALLLCMVFCGLYARSGQPVADSAKVIREVVVRGEQQPDIIPSQQLKGEQLGRLSGLNVADALRFFAGV